jgi:hypothetical protein
MARGDGVGRGSEVGMSLRDRQALVVANGWQPTSDAQRLTYTIRRAPREYLETLRARMWSHTWSMSDEQLNAGIAAVERFISDQYGDPDTTEDITAHFVAQAYTPPS